MAHGTDGGAPPATRDRLAIGAIFKNEGPYVLEWIAHHRALGIERFFLADNDSTDETTATLAALARAGLVEHIPFASVPGRPPQPAAYDLILRQFRTEADWIVFIDADEFLVPAPPHRTLAAVIATLHPGPDVGAIVVNWAVYGSSGQRQAGTAPVSERFIRRAEQGNPINRHYKSIVRPAAVQGKVRNPHHFPLREGLRTIQVDGVDVADVPGLKGLSARIVWDPLRINHYVVKSWDEFYYRKRARGRATRADGQRNAKFFQDHDRNDVVDPMPPWLTQATETEGRRLERLLAGAAAGARPEPAGHGLSAWRSRLSALLPRADRPLGAVEAVEIQGDTALVRGWALTPRKEAAEGFTIALDDQPVAVASLVKTRRSDIPARFPGASSDCGFDLKIAWPPALTRHRSPVPLRVTARYAANRSFDLSSTKANWHMASPSPPAKAAPRSIPVPDQPSMPPKAVAALVQAVEQVSCYLEYGSGGSTVLALDLKVPVIISVESDRDWLQAVRRKLAARGGLLDHHHLLHVDIGRTKIHGYPASDEAWRKFPAYPLTPWELCRTRGLHPEVVLIDGRFRVACFLATLLFARPGCRILFDDYQDRAFYHSVRSFAAAGPTFGRMATFAVPGTVDRDAVWQALVQAVGDPR